jgi:hypothetical protein
VTKATDALKPSYIQSLFAMKCGFEEPEDESEFWERHVQDMSKMS